MFNSVHRHQLWQRVPDLIFRMTKDDGQLAAWQGDRVKVAQVSAGLGQEGGEDEKAALATWPEAEPEAAVLSDVTNTHKTRC